MYEVVELCGGYTANANESCINPVRKVSDGEKIYIPYVGEDYSRGFMMMILIRHHRSMLHRYMVIMELHSRIRASISTQRLRSS